MSAREIVSASAAPAAVGPYSQAVRAGDWLYCSGQIPLDPETGRLIDGDMEAQTRRVMANLGAVLQAAGLDFGNAIKTTLYLLDMNDFPAMNAAYGSFFETDPPARATLQVAALPLGARICIDLVAVADGGDGRP